MRAAVTERLGKGLPVDFAPAQLGQGQEWPKAGQMCPLPARTREQCVRIHLAYESLQLSAGGQERVSALLGRRLQQLEGVMGEGGHFAVPHGGQLLGAGGGLCLGA